MYYLQVFCFTFASRFGQVVYHALFKTVTFILWWLAVLSGSVTVAQTTYYVAANGNDVNDGRSAESPFQTLSKINGLSLQAGDQVLFRRGDTFRGTLTIRRSGSAGQPIVFDAYGDGAKPALSGSVPVTGWTNIGGSVWQATCTTCGNQVTGLHRNNAALPLGRYPNFDTPNKGYLTVQSHTGNGQIVSRQAIPLNLNTGWQGSEVAIRSMQWIIDRAGISSQSGNALNLMSQTLTYPINDGWGFFIQNHPATLDQTGEWCFDTSNKTVRLYDPAADPNGQTLTATVHRAAVDIASVSFVTLRNLHLTETLYQGLLANNTSNLTLSNLDVTRSGENGVQIIGSGNNVVMEDCRVVDVNNNGVWLDAYKNVTLRNNLIRRVGTRPGRGKGGDGQYNGLASSADENVLIEGNRVDSIGYNGISFWNNTLLQRNVVTNYCMTKSDGGGLYVWNGTRRAMANIRVRSNMVYNGFGAPEGTPNGAYSGVNGFFLDDCVHNVELTGNTTYNNHGLGFFLHAVSGITVRGNTSFGNGEGQLAMTHNHGLCPARSNVVANNVFVSRLFGEFNVKYESDQNDLPDYGQIDSNYYVRPFEKEFVVRAVWNYGPGIRGADFNVEEWRSRFGKDIRTVASPVVHKDYQVTQVVGQPRFTTPFATDLSGWSVMLNQPGAGRADWVDGGGLDGGSLRVSFPQPSGETWFFNSRIMVAMGAGVIQAGKTYRLSFDAVATSNTKRIQAFLQTPGTPSYYFDSRTMLIAGTTRKRHEVVFTPTTNLTNAQVGFQIFEDGQTIWFDNVQFEEVTTTPVNPDDRMRLLSNPTTRDSVITLSGSYRDEKGQARSGQVTLAPFTSLVLLTDDGSTPPPPPPPAVLRDPENPTGVVAGLDYRYYEGTWTSLPDFTALTPVKTGTTGVPDISVRDRDNAYGLRFTGFIDVPTDGQYTFYTNSDDGSKLFIGTTEVVNNDAVVTVTEKLGTIGLKAGKHAITVVYYQNTQAQSLSVSYEGPGIGKQTIPASAFYRVGTVPPPPPPPVVLRDPENPAGVVVGLDYRYYEGTWMALPDFTALTPVKTGTTGVPDISVRNRDDLFGLRFTGFVDVPTDGTYTFYTASDDGSKLFIGTTEVVNHDGTHPQTEQSGTIGLKAGKHAITVVYFENGGGEGLNVSYSGPGVSKQIISAGAFYRVGTAPPPPPPVVLRDPENPAGVVVGLDYRYYEGTWTALPDFNALTPVKTGTTGVPDLTVRNRNDYFGLRFTGFVDVPADGQYTFYTNSDDGSKLFIGSTEVVSHDGTHAQTEKSGTIGLKAGKHAITVVYFDNSGGEGLSVSYSGPGVNKQTIPASAFYRVGTASPPPPPVTLRDPENPAEVVVGLDYGYYEGTWTALPNFTSLTPVKTGTTGVPDLTVRNRNDFFGLRFTGYVDVPADGMYTFFTSSDDGSKLLIGTTEVVSHDGTHAQTEKSGTIGLKAGKHAITVVYFDNSGGEGLSVSYSGPGVNKQTIPAGAFYRVGTAPPPPPPVTLRDPENPADAVVGLDYGYYEGTWTALPNFTTLIPVKTGTTGIPDLTVRNRNDYFGLRFTGFVNVPADGTYTFFTSSDDGSKLLIGTTEVVSHDGTHAQTEKSGTIGLKAGKHAITVVYFDNSGGEGLSVSYSGPGVNKQTIPAGAFYRIPSANTVGSGTGLRAEYYNNTNLAAPIALTRTDAVINFDWGNGSPAAGIGNDNYSARWTGQVEAPVTGNYVFSTVSDDGVRLWVNGVQVINNWTTHGPTTDNSPTIALTAGQKYDIRMEYFESAQGAVARLRWAYPGQGQQPIPQGWLYPAASGGRVGAPDAVAESGSVADGGVVVYPVPARDAVSIRYPADADGRVTVQLLNTLGQSVLSVEEPVVGGENLIRLDVRPYPRGLYMLRLTQGGRHLTHKVLLME